MPEGVSLDNLIDETLASDEVVQTLTYDAEEGLDMNSITELVENLVSFTEEFENGVQVAVDAQHSVEEFSSMIEEELNGDAVSEVAEEIIEAAEDAGL